MKYSIKFWFYRLFSILDDEIGFMEINPITAHLIQSLQLNNGQTGLQLLKNIAEQLNHSDPDVVIKGGQQILEQLRDVDILLGTRTSS